MFPTSFAESNMALGRPENMAADECEPLSVLVTQSEGGTPVCISLWKMTADELAEINRTGRVWITVCGYTMPPIAVDGIKPFGVEGAEYRSV